jgi:dTDP-4-amino-4,6-dideoxygalactose transaminase
MQVPFFDLTRQYGEIKPEIDEAIAGVLSNGIFTNGSNVSLFEEEFASYIGVKYAVGLSSGTDALTLGIKALGLGVGDEVIVPANVYPTAFGVALSGVTLKLVDCGWDGNLDPMVLENVITKNTKAIIVVHLYGNPANISAITKLPSFQAAKPLIIEDCAQAHGALVRFSNPDYRFLKNTAPKNSSNIEYQKSNLIRVGSIGDIGCFSFYPTKNVGAYGDGGMVVTNNIGVASELRKLRQYGEKMRYQSEIVGGISRLDELQAAVLRVKLRYVDAWTAKKREIAKLYSDEFSKLKIPDMLSCSTVDPSVGISAPHLFVIRSKHRDTLKENLKEKGIATAIHYPAPVHLQKSFTKLGYKAGGFPVAETLAKEILSLPLFPELRQDEVQHVCKVVGKYVTTP